MSKARRHGPGPVRRSRRSSVERLALNRPGADDLALSCQRRMRVQPVERHQARDGRQCAARSASSATELDPLAVADLVEWQAVGEIVGHPTLPFAKLVERRFRSSLVPEAAQRRLAGNDRLGTGRIVAIEAVVAASPIQSARPTSAPPAFDPAADRADQLADLLAERRIADSLLADLDIEHFDQSLGQRDRWPDRRHRHRARAAR